MPFEPGPAAQQARLELRAGLIRRAGELRRQIGGAYRRANANSVRLTEPAEGLDASRVPPDGIDVALLKRRARELAEIETVLRDLDA
jgi:hypothetical protein